MLIFTTTHKIGVCLQSLLAFSLVIGLEAVCLAKQEPAAPVDSAPVPPKLSVEEIVTRNAKARGGLDSWHDIKTMVQMGRVERLGKVPMAGAHPNHADGLTPDASQIVDLRVQMARPNKLRYEMTYRGITAIQAFDGREGFTVQPSPRGAVARPFTDAQVHALSEQFEIEGPLLSAAQKGIVVKDDGIEVLRGKPAYRLRLTMKSGVTRHVWVDAQSFLDVQLDGARQVGERVWPVTTRFDDFRKVGKVQIPYQVETSIGEAAGAMERVRLAKVSINVPLEDSLFVLPRAPDAKLATQ